MEGAFDMLNQFTDFVVVETRSAAERPGSHDETVDRAAVMLLRQAETEETVHDLLERTA